MKKGGLERERLERKRGSSAIQEVHGAPGRQDGPLASRLPREPLASIFGGEASELKENREKENTA